MICLLQQRRFAVSLLAVSAVAFVGAVVLVARPLLAQMPAGMGGGMGGGPMGGGMGGAGGGAAGANLGQVIPPATADAIAYEDFLHRTGLPPTTIPDYYLYDGQGAERQRTYAAWHQLYRIYRNREEETPDVPLPEYVVKPGFPGTALFQREHWAESRALEEMRVVEKVYHDAIDRAFSWEVSYPQIFERGYQTMPVEEGGNGGSSGYLPLRPPAPNGIEGAPAGVFVDPKSPPGGVQANWIAPGYQIYIVCHLDRDYPNRVVQALQPYDLGEYGRGGGAGLYREGLDVDEGLEIITKHDGYERPHSIRLSREAASLWEQVLWPSTYYWFALLDSDGNVLVERTSPMLINPNLSGFSFPGEINYMPLHRFVLPEEKLGFEGRPLDMDYKRGWVFTEQFSAGELTMEELRTIDRAVVKVFLQPTDADSQGVQFSPAGGLGGGAGGAGGAGGGGGMMGGAGPGGMGGAMGGGMPGGAGGAGPGAGGTPGGARPGGMR